MKIFGFEFKRAEKALQPAGGWTNLFSTTGYNWQQPISQLTDTEALSYSAIYACVNLISSSISKLPLGLIELTEAGVWRPTTSPAYSPLLRRPARQYDRITFFQYLVNSLLLAGNSYALKHFDNRGVLVNLSLLDPRAVEPLVSDSGEVFYRLDQNRLAGLTEAQRTVPARFIAHWLINPMISPLIGCAPLHAAIDAATAGSAIMDRQASIHSKRPQIFGTLSIPANLKDDQAQAAKEAWNTSTGPNGTGTPVLRNGVAFQPLTLTAHELESIKALELSNLDICRAFGVHPSLVAAGPVSKDPEAEMLAFQNTTLSPLIEKIELGLDEAMNLPASVGVEFDTKALYRLAPLTRAKVAGEQIKAGYLAPNEARADEGREPKEGGDSPMIQQQNYSLAALAKRDAKDDPFGKSDPAPEPQPNEDQLAELEEKIREELEAEMAA